MKTTVRIFTQTYENYGYRWKAKGGQEFEIAVDLDLLMYEKDACIEAFKGLLLEQSDNMFRYEYLSHEPVFHEPVKLDGDKFARLVAANFKMENN